MSCLTAEPAFAVGYTFYDASTKHSPRLDDLYEYGKLLGAGTGGSVRLATEKASTNKVVAIKTIKYVRLCRSIKGCW
jgi:hypothetical protein